MKFLAYFLLTLSFFVVGCDDNQKESVEPTRVIYLDEVDDVIAKHEEVVTLDDLEIEKPSRSELLEPLLIQIHEQTVEQLPFDEPKTEEGQQDGLLRVAWYKAYRRKQARYYVNGDRYYVWNKGKPHVPQVCADFLVDSIDRTAGTWYYAKFSWPRRIQGTIDFREQVTDAGFDPRRLAELVEYFHEHPDDFEFMFEGKDGERVGNLQKLQAFLKEHDTQLGDIIIIKGRARWDNYRVDHSHSFFVTELDENGFVDKVTGNPVYAVERSLKAEGGRTPRRRITHIIRLTDSFLERIIPEKQENTQDVGKQ